MLTRTAALSALLLVACGNAAPPAPAAPTPSSAPSSEPAPAPTASAEADAAAPAPVASAKPAPAEDTSGSPLERLMRAHFKETAAVRTAVINGKLAEAVAPADALAKMDGLGTPQASWKPSLEALSAASRRIAQSPDIPGAAAAIADIGVACGQCHKSAGGPKVKVDAPPAGDNSLAGRMQRHAWATDRLWEALYVPNDASWKAGVDALGADPFPKEVLDKGGVHARSAASRFKTLVASAGDKKKADDRAKVYAGLLETCSSCHMAARGGK